MDTMKQMQRTVLPLLMLCGLAACSDDDWKDDVAALQEPTPTSIVIMDNAGIGRLRKEVSFSLWEHIDADRSAIRLVTDWATSKADIEALLALL